MGYRDEIMVTGEVDYLLKKNPNSKFVIGDGKNIWWSEIYENNNNILNANQYKNYHNVIWIKNYPHHRPYRIYKKNIESKKYLWNKTYIAKKGKLFFSNNEILFANEILNKIKSKYLKKIIHIEPNVKNTRGYLNRQWGLEKWQKVVNELNQDYVFLQTSFGNQNILENVVNVPNINFRLACTLLMGVDLFVGLHGGMSHAAAALDKKGVIIFGGWCDPKNLGYKAHSNLYINDKMSPCGSKNNCDHCKKCMELINFFL